MLVCYRTYVAVACVAILLTAFSVVVAFTEGADAGASGGPANSGENCTACHEFYQGSGGVELLGAPNRYRSGAVYELTVRVFDPELVCPPQNPDCHPPQGAGFQISAESISSHAGTMLVRDEVNTRDAPGGAGDYITHSSDGVADSILNWATNGGAYEYTLAWQAPAADMGSVAFFTAGKAISNGDFADFDRFYAAFATMTYAETGDSDGDTDIDLRDFAAFQRCFNGDDPAVGEGCEYVDSNGDGLVSLVDIDPWIDATGPTATLPGGYVMADAVRGGLLYDKWWTVIGAAEPVGDHPLYPPAGLKSGSTTHRCKECHGWDYKGSDGVYGSLASEHYTGIPGVFSTTAGPQQLFDLLKSDLNETPNGHGMADLGMSDRDLWDVVKMVREGTVDTDDFIDAGGSFTGDRWNGSYWYGLTCLGCHEEDGKRVPFEGDAGTGHVGTVANDNPWELLHKMRFGHPGSSMLGTELLGWTAAALTDLGTHTATLPTE